MTKLFYKINQVLDITSYTIPFNFFVTFALIEFHINKDDNIHESEALKWKDKRTLTLIEFQN